MKLTASNLAYFLYCASIVVAAPTVKRVGTAYDGGDTANDVEDGVCAPLTLIFARGSTESGNIGSSVGPALAKSLISFVGSSGIAIQGVDYPATIESNISMGSESGPELAKLAQQALKQCPNTKVAISGYSQGATVCHYAVASAGLSADDVSSAVLYGDPEDGEAVGSLPSRKLKEFCASGDGVCEDHGFDITPAHLSYPNTPDIGEGATFIIQHAGATASSGSPSTSASPSSPAETSSATSPFGSLPSFSGGLGGLGSGGDSGLGGLGSLTGSTGSTSSSGLGSFFKRWF